MPVAPRDLRSLMLPCILHRAGCKVETATASARRLSGIASARAEWGRLMSERYRALMMLGTQTRKFIPWFCCTALLAVAPAVVSRTYKWVDESGVTHYSETRPADQEAEELSSGSPPGVEAADGDNCSSLICRAARLESERKQQERAEQEKRDAAAKAAAAYPVFPTPVKETDDEKIARLVAECKRSRGSNCDSDEEKRRMLLQNVELTHAERRALRGLSPAQQRRVLNQRIPERYRNID